MRETKNNKEKNTITLQITLFDVEGKYKPISTLVEVESIEWYRKHSKEVKQRAYQKICNQRYLTGKELLKLGYKEVKVRNYTLWKQIQEGKRK